MEQLSYTNQHLVFQNDMARMQTVQLIKTQFSLNEVGTRRVDALNESRCDRELVGHLIAMLNYNISELQTANNKLRSDLFCNTLSQKKLEESQGALSTENEALRNTNETLSLALNKFGLNVSPKNCEILKAAMSLIKNEDGFEVLDAAVRCFGSTPDPQVDDEFNVFDLDRGPLPVGREDQMEHAISPPPPDTIASCIDEPSAPFLPSPCVPEQFTSIPQVNLYQLLLHQQQLHRQLLLQRAASSV